MNSVPDIQMTKTLQPYHPYHDEYIVFFYLLIYILSSPRWV